MDVRRARCAVAGLALAACSAGAPAKLTVPLEAQRVACMNTVSGFTWTLSLDPQRRTVDGWPAEFSATQVSWRNETDQGGYTLDRVSGQLTIIRASSTGGIANVDRCRA